MLKTIFRKLKPDECPICLGKLKLYEMEVEITRLTPLAQKDEIEDSSYTALLICDDCGSSFPVEKRGDCWRIKPTLPRVKKELKSYNPFQI